MRKLRDSFDIDLADFEEKVLTASHQRVLVDFWAD